MMPANRKVIWAEGMLLGQQHFQSFEQFIRHQQTLLQRHALPYNWGLAELEVDESYLAQGIFRLIRCIALLKDGRWIDFNHVFDEPLTHTLPEEAMTALDVYLVLPESNAVAGISGYPEPLHSAGWKADYCAVRDEYDSERESEVLLARQNLALHIGETPPDGLSAIKIAELAHNPQQLSYQVNRNYFPTVLKLGASMALVSWTAALKGKIRQQIAILNDQKAKHRHVHNQFGYADFIYFNLVKSLTSHLPKVCELLQAPHKHPYYLYQTCIAFIGELQGYLDAPLAEADLPLYQHQALNQVFHELNSRIENLLVRILPANTLDIGMEQLSNTRYQSTILSTHDLNSKQFCLALYHEDIRPEFIKKILAQIKIASPNHLDHLIQSFTPGIAFDYLASPGKDLMAKRNYHYFLLNKQSKGWEDVVKEGRLAFFVSPDLASHSFELISYA